MKIFGRTVKLNFKFWRGAAKGALPTPMIGLEITRNDLFKEELDKLGPDPITFHGKSSHFGGPKDTGVSTTEDLAFFQTMQQVRDRGKESYFLKRDDNNLARNLNPGTFYIACRWKYNETSRDYLMNNKVLVRNPSNGSWCWCQPIDWGPHERTGRSCDLSPGAMNYLDASTDDFLLVYLKRPLRLF